MFQPALMVMAAKPANATTMIHLSMRGRGAGYRSTSVLRSRKATRSAEMAARIASAIASPPRSSPGINIAEDCIAARRQILGDNYFADAITAFERLASTLEVTLVPVEDAQEFLSILRQGRQPPRPRAIDHRQQLAKRIFTPITSGKPEAHQSIHLCLRKDHAFLQATGDDAGEGSRSTCPPEGP
jgi:hypothetical protein